MATGMIDCGKLTCDAACSSTATKPAVHCALASRKPKHAARQLRQHSDLLYLFFGPIAVRPRLHGAQATVRVLPLDTVDTLEGVAM